MAIIEDEDDGSGIGGRIVVDGGDATLEDAAATMAAAVVASEEGVDRTGCGVREILTFVADGVDDGKLIDEPTIMGGAVDPGTVDN